MSNFKKPLPEWNQRGIEPSASKKTTGWLVDERPPSEYMNWFQFTAFQALQELQSLAIHKEELTTLTSELIKDATTSTKGIVQLNDTTTSTSTTQSATANAVKKVYDSVNSQNVNEITPKLVTNQPALYPRGISVFSLDLSTSQAWRDNIGGLPVASYYGLVTTTRAGEITLQKIILMPYTTTNETVLYQREAVSTNLWRAWRKVTY